MPAPLAFTFRIDPIHRDTPIASLRIAAATRVAVLRAGIERLGELDGLTAAQLANLPRVAPSGALSVVRALRWRCAHSLPSWQLIRATPVVRLPAPLNHVRATMAVRRHFPDSCAPSHGPIATLADVFVLGPDALARRTNTQAAGQIDPLFDQLARIAELEPDSLRRVCACPEPLLLPAIDPLVIIAAARASSADERLAALALGLSERDSTIVLLRWGIGGTARPTFAEVAARFGITAERVRQIVEERERAIAISGLRLEPNGGGHVIQCLT